MYSLVTVIKCRHGYTTYRRASFPPAPSEVAADVFTQFYTSL